MKIYKVYEWIPWDSPDDMAYFSTREKAEAWLKEYKSRLIDYPGIDNFDIEEIELDNPPKYL